MNAPCPILLRIFVPVLVALVVQPAAAATHAELPSGARVLEPAQVAALEPRAASQARRHLEALRAGEVVALPAPVASAKAGALALAVLVERDIARQLAREPGVGEAVLQELAGRPVMLWRRHEETAGDWFVPLVDVAAEARTALQAQRLLAGRQAWRERLAKGLDPASLPEAGSEASRSLRMALAELDPGRLSQFAEGLDSAPKLPWDLALALAEAAPSRARIERALRLGPPEARARLLQRADRLLPAAEAAALYRDWRGDKALGSLAVAGLGRLAPSQPSIVAELVVLLSHPELGDSAAAALAAPRDGRHVEQLESRKAGADDVLLRRLALAYRLDGSPQARRALERLAATPGLPASLRAELGR